MFKNLTALKKIIFFLGLTYRYSTFWPVYYIGPQTHFHHIPFHGVQSAQRNGGKIQVPTQTLNVCELGNSVDLMWVKVRYIIPASLTGNLPSICTTGQSKGGVASTWP